MRGSVEYQHTVSVALAEVLAHADSQPGVGEGSTAEGTSSGRLAVAANIVGAQGDLGNGIAIDRAIGRDIDCGTGWDIAPDADDRIGDGERAQAEKEDEGSHTWIVVPPR